jgi:hypothetical protein
MEQNTADKDLAPTAERRAWEAPRVVAVVPVDRTQGGVSTSILELHYAGVGVS